MAKKIRKQKQKQKQKQVQNVNQKVIVRIGEVTKKKSRRRRSTRKPKEQSEISMMQSLQPNVIYQSYKPEQIPSSQPTQNLPLETAPTVKNMVPETVKQPTSRGAFEDVGVGTEGFVTILDVPTKKEQLSELITPVARTPVPSTGELPPWLKDTQPHPAFVQPTFYKPKEESSSVFSTTPIKPSLESPPWLASGFQTPFTPSAFNAEPTDISKTTNVEKELTELADFIHNAAYPIGRPLEGPSITESLPVQQSQPEKFSSMNKSKLQQIDKLNTEFNNKDLNNLENLKSMYEKRPSIVKKMSEQITRTRRKKQEMQEAKLMGMEDINIKEQFRPVEEEFGLPANFFQAKPEPTFFEKLQQIPSEISRLPPTESKIVLEQKQISEKPKKVAIKNPVKKILTEEQRLARNAKARAIYASKK